jgi:hypothetical protein
MATITGKVINADGSANSGAKVYVSDFKGTLTPKKIGAISDDNGNFTLDITDKDGEYISASDSLKNLVVTKIKENVTNYLLDMGAGRIQQIQEVVVFPPQKQPQQKKRWIYYVLMGLGVIGITYVAIKQYKSK